MIFGLVGGLVFDQAMAVIATLKFINDITSAFDSTQFWAAMFIDLGKAFDTVDHSQTARHD